MSCRASKIKKERCQLGLGETHRREELRAAFLSGGIQKWVNHFLKPKRLMADGAVRKDLVEDFDPKAWRVLDEPNEALGEANLLVYQESSIEEH